jgi:hypothetical protein
MSDGTNDMMTNDDMNQMGPDYQGFEFCSGKQLFYLKRPLILLFPELKWPGLQANHSPRSSV